ncbi:MAG: hybrid sensor histidine kinase/response regulator [Alphaproteobacteria bacterium]|nr:hybrid sensor histidine kinase/response regulator [Alphaproteobacteria bacterium]
MDDLIGEFLAETGESLDVIDAELVRFEANPSDRAILDNVFRLLHTIKGTCGFLALTRLEAVAHAGETLLGRFRDGTRAPDSHAVTLVLEALDRIKLILRGMETGGAEPQGDDRDLIARLEALAEGRIAAPPPPPPTPQPIRAAEPEPACLDAKPEADGEWRYDADLGRPLRPGEVSLAELEAAFLATPGPQDIDDADEAGEGALLTAPASGAPPVHAAPAAAGPRGAATIRVSVDVLEGLMTTVSELVLARNQMQQLVHVSDDGALKGPLQRLTSVTAELQDGVMKARLQPVGDAWRKLPRIVRDACQDLGKQIRLVQEGEDTELDRQVLELIRDPLTHMIRNACDHGIERPEVRRAAGKPGTGTIRLSACHEGGAIVLTLADDGAGLDARRIRDKVLEKGLATPEELAGMSEAQVQRFIFAPGFSTAAAVTSLSGRGVGMDVVRTNIEQIGGAIDLTSAPGAGTVFTIRIPLTLAIISALIVEAGGARFATPQLSVRELVRVGPQAAVKIETLNGAHLIRLRDRLLPVVALSAALHPDAPAPIPSSGYVVVLEAAGRRIGLMVDDVIDTVEIVVKPLSGLLRQTGVFAGATIMGDGSVIMILDPNGLAQACAIAGEGDGEAQAETARASAAVTQGPPLQRLLLVRAGGPAPKAVPVSLITRLEELDASAIECIDARHVAQYRGQLLPLAHAAGPGAFRTDGRQPVLVFTEDGRSAGVAVDAILDVVEEAFDLELGSHRPGVIGSAIIQGQATDLLDIAWFMQRAWDAAPPRSASVRASRPAVLLVDADAFSRRMLAPLLAAAGYELTIASGLHEARDAARMGARYDVLVGDPGALAKLAAEGLFADVPRLGVADGASGILDGFVAIMPPGDRGGLIAALDQAARAA